MIARNPVQEMLLSYYGPHPDHEDPERRALLRWFNSCTFRRKLVRHAKNLPASWLLEQFAQELAKESYCASRSSKQIQLYVWHMYIGHAKDILRTHAGSIAKHYRSKR